MTSAHFIQAPLCTCPRAMGKNTGNAQKKGGDKGPADGADGVRFRVHQHGASCSARLRKLV